MLVIKLPALILKDKTNKPLFSLTLNCMQVRKSFTTYPLILFLTISVYDH